MLYLPAGWLHEVTSSNGANKDRSLQEDAMKETLLDSHREDFHNPQDNSVHMALNYWFHPPDNLHCMDICGYPTVKPENGFARPYVRDYWETMYQKQRGE